jgi:hypothetical protein
MSVIVKEDDCMLGHVERRSAANRCGGRSLPTGVVVGCEALESRQLLSRGLGLGAFGNPVLIRQAGSLPAELGSIGGGGTGALFGAGKLGLGGGVRSPFYLLTASLLNTGSGTTTPPSKSVLSSSAVQSAFQTLQTDLNNDVKVGARPSHASVGQLQDDLLAIRKGALTGGAATSAIQVDEAAILTSLGLSTSQVGQIQSDLQAVQSTIQSASGSGDASTTTTTGATGTTGGSTSTPSGTDPFGTDPSASMSGSPSPISAVPSALQTLQSDLQSDLSADAQPTHASVGPLQDDLDALRKGALNGSQAVTTIKSDAAAVLSSVGLSQDQINRIQSDQAALASAIQAQSGQTAGSSASSTGSSASPTSLAAVEATTQSVQPYLIGVPGVGGPWIGRLGGPGIGGFGGRGMGGFGPRFGGWR